MEFVNHWDQEFVLDGLGVESTVVDVNSLGTVLLADEEHMQGEGRCTGEDDPLPQHGITLLPDLVIM